MRRLFLKIFLGFWAAVMIAGAATVAVTILFPSQTFIYQATSYFAFNLATTGKIGAGLYEKDGAAALDAFMANIDTISSFRLHLISAEGESLRGSPLPGGGREFALHTLTVPAVQFKDLATQPLMAVRTVSDSGRTYVAMLELPLGLVPYFLTLTPGHVLRLTAALLSAGCICYLFARYLTDPVLKLQAAVRRFAQGDLKVRVSPGLGRRTDEIANLGRDFDAMAAQIETLMGAHERLLRDVAHELRSPLARLNVALEITRKHTGEEASACIDRISQEAGRLNQLITQLLTLSRLANAEPAVQMRPIALEEVIARIAQDAQFEGQTRNCWVSFACLDKCTLLMDGNLIRSAVENVVRNALRFSPPGTQVQIVQTIEAAGTDRLARIDIKDAGPGMAEEDLGRLFQPFFRAGQAKNGAGSGAGLGLAIAHRAVTIHRGSIVAENSSAGGLIVQIRLPLGTPDDSPAHNFS